MHEQTKTEEGRADEYLAAAAQADPVREKLSDAMTPGWEVEFDPDEAERAGAFVEDALGEAEAADSSTDLPDVEARPSASDEAGALPGL